MIWGVIASELHDLDFRTGGGDFELTQIDITNTGPATAAEETAAGLVLPDFAVNELINEELRVLYDGRTSAELYGEEIADNPGHEGPMINVFLANEEWYDDHPEEIAFFMQLWQRGIDEWQANQADIIASYPQHFAVEGDDQVAIHAGLAGRARLVRHLGVSGSGMARRRAPDVRHHEGERVHGGDRTTLDSRSSPRRR